MIFNLTRWGSNSGGSGPDLSVVTATANDVLSGKTFVNAGGAPINGMMQNRGAIAGTMDGIVMASYTVPQGYHNGSGTVSLTSDIEDWLAAY